MKILKSRRIPLGIAALSMLITLNSCFYSSRSCRELLKKAMTKQYDMVIVPGYPFEDGKWSTAMKARVYWSKYLYDKGIAKNVMYSGNAVYSPYYEGMIMALYAEAIGIPKEHIYTELIAEHSTENVYYSYKKSKKLGFKTFAVASDPFQSKMLQGFINRFSKHQIDIIPFVYDTLKAMEATMIDPVIDYNKAFVKDFIPLPEREGFWKRFRGTQGRDIDTTVYN